MSKPIAPVSCNSERDAFWLGVREASKVPATIMSASFIGFGSMVHNAGWNIGHGVVTTLTTWALPGQIMLVEMFNTGAPLLAIAISIGMINARIFPMVVSLLPMVRKPGIPGWVYFVIANAIAVTTWMGVMLRIPYLRPEHRFSYLLGYGGLLWSISPFFTAIGFLLADMVPKPISVGLVFLNPLYFTLLFLVDLKKPSKIIALALGAVLGPLLFMLSSDWSLLLTGIIGGTAAYFLGQRIDGPADDSQTEQVASVASDGATIEMGDAN